MAHAIHFDTFEYVEDLISAGVDEKTAKAQALATKKSIEKIVAQIREDTKNTKSLTEGKFLYEMEKVKSGLHIEIEKVKSDLSIEIEKIRSEMLKWVVGVGASTVILLGGMIAKGFHWF